MTPTDDLPTDELADDNLPDDDMEEWRAWQDRDYHEQLRGKDPLP